MHGLISWWNILSQLSGRDYPVIVSVSWSIISRETTRPKCWVGMVCSQKDREDLVLSDLKSCSSVCLLKELPEGLRQPSVEIFLFFKFFFDNPSNEIRDELMRREMRHSWRKKDLEKECHGNINRFGRPSCGRNHITSTKKITSSHRKSKKPIEG